MIAVRTADSLFDMSVEKRGGWKVDCAVGRTGQNQVRRLQMAQSRPLETFD